MILLQLLIALCLGAEQLTGPPIVLAGEIPENAPDEQMCFYAARGGNIDANGICYAFGQTIIFKEDTIYNRTDLVAIVMKESQIKCKTKSGNPCAVTIALANPVNATYLELYDHSKIHGSKIFIESPSTRLTIDATSEIEVNGRSTSTKGTSPTQGASYLGQGGYCGTGTFEDLYYGSFFLEPDTTNIYDMYHDYMIGSIGIAGDLSTGGGGHIHINVDSLNLTGNGTQI